MSSPNVSGTRINTENPLESVNDPVPGVHMDICDTKPMEMSSPNVSGSRINADITLELVSDPVPMGLCDTEQIEISSLNAVSGKNIDIPLELSIETTPPILEVTDMKSNVDCAESKSHSNNKLAPSFNAKLGYKTSASSNSQFVPKISRGRNKEVKP
ncbi:uncharacterized protein LOC125236956 [Leguminivora glycinivorella]|uniref:uncharacterized protein LOC125236956 n=1 Tax=Leguminivora glycinivorella TaxID=1035111 RepID=UPI00200E3544|nr:uncharacterized protein LOC125236956 [Leguminivora glycinivorella]